MSSIHDAIQEENFTETERLLQESPDCINQADENGHTPLYWAAILNQEETARRLLAMGGRANFEVPRREGEKLPLHQAIKDEAFESAKLLLELGAKVNEDALSLAISNDHFEMIELILEKMGRADNSDLHYAARRCDTQLAELLLRYHADVNAKDPHYENQTPLHQAAGAEKHYGDPDEMVRLLLSHKADINITDDLGRTPIDVAVANDNISAAKLLLAAGAKYPDELIAGAARINDLDLFHACLQNNCNVDAIDSEGATALHYAARNENLGIIKILNAHNADLNIRDNKGNAPLHYAAMVAFKDEDYYKYESEGIKDKGATVATYLLKTGRADLEPINNAGLAPIEIALNRSYDQMAAVLRYYGAEPDWHHVKGFIREQWFEGLSTDGRNYLKIKKIKI